MSLGSQDLKSFNLYCPILPTTTPTSYTYTPPSRGGTACLPPAVGGVGLVPQFVLLKNGVQGNWGVGGLGGADLRGNCDSSQVAAGKQRFDKTGQKFHR